MRLPPDQFWSLTLGEWRMILEATTPSDAMNREALSRLQSLYPDDPS